MKEFKKNQKYCDFFHGIFSKLKKILAMKNLNISNILTVKS